MHDAEIVRFLGQLLVILLSAKAFGELAVRLGQPAVLGELIGGVLLGSGIVPFFDAKDPVLALMAEVGVVLLMFETGIHCDLREMAKVGSSSLLVALAGVVAPFLLGWGVMTALGHGGMPAVFVGAALTATSVGITARVLSDMGVLDRPESRIILGAAVIDDVVGIVILSAVAGLASSGVLSWGAVTKTVLLSSGFLAGALLLGPALSRGLVEVVRRMRGRGVLVGAAVCFAFAMALAAHALGTALIVGAFTAGILLAGTDRKEDVDQTIKPVTDVFAPVFFVMVGAKVDLAAFSPAREGAAALWGLSLLLCAVAVAGKLLSGLAVLERGAGRWAVGVGMVPRGEVGLIFAQVGLASGVVGSSLYGSVVGMVVLTTFLAPPLLKRAFGR